MLQNSLRMYKASRMRVGMCSERFHLLFCSVWYNYVNASVSTRSVASIRALYHTRVKSGGRWVVDRILICPQIAGPRQWSPFSTYFRLAGRRQTVPSLRLRDVWLLLAADLGVVMPSQSSAQNQTLDKRYYSVLDV